MRAAGAFAAKIAGLLVCALGVEEGLSGAVRILVRDGHPVVDGVYVNGHGPYRFLVDTGANVNLIEPNLARSIGLTASFRMELASSAGVTIAPGSDGIEVILDSVREERQRFLFLQLGALHERWPDIQGVLGQWFLSQVDYVLDLQAKRLTFGRQDVAGTRAPLRTIGGRTAVSTNLGNLVLDSGAERLVLFGVEPQAGLNVGSELRTYTGSRQIGMASSKPLTIEGRKIWQGYAVAIPERAEQGVEGLLPLSLFKAIYVCNSEGYVVFR